MVFAFMASEDVTVSLDDVAAPIAGGRRALFPLGRGVAFAGCFRCFLEPPANRQCLDLSPLCRFDSLLVHLVSEAPVELLDLSVLQDLFALRTTELIPCFSIQLRVQMYVPAFEADSAVMISGVLVGHQRESIDRSVFCADCAFSSFHLDPHPWRLRIRRCSLRVGIVLHLHSWALSAMQTAGLVCHCAVVGVGRVVLVYVVSGLHGGDGGWC